MRNIARSTTIVMIKRLVAVGLIFASTVLFAASYYTARPDDPKAIYLTPESYPVKGDGVADDTAGLQQAIDKVQ